MKTKKTRISLVSIVLVASLVLTSVSAVLATEIVNDAKQGILENTAEGEKIHDSIDISTIRNEGGNPPELLSKASALAAAEKPWYEYIRYSSEAVGICNLTETSRIVFHDPYDYGNSLIMEIDDTITDWSSSNSLTATYETGNSVTFENQVSNETVSSIEVAKGPDYTEDVSNTTTKGRVETYNESKTEGKVLHKGESSDSGTTEDEGRTDYDYWDSNETLSEELEFGPSKTKLELSATQHWGGVDETNKTTIDTKTTYDDYTEYSEDYKVTDKGWTEDKSTVTTKTEVNSYIADRMSSSLGQNISETQSWSTNNSHSISKTYNASYFNASGSPLQWKIVKYSVIMPLLYKVQYYVEGEWITAEDGYCTLTTIQGTCRAWMENNQAFYEHWGTGEPVTWNEFWGTFFTKEKLVEAYQNRLYPNQIRSVSAE